MIAAAAKTFGVLQSLVFYWVLITHREAAEPVDAFQTRIVTQNVVLKADNRRHKGPFK
jgi:hypothetical protein